tara:strand:- start:1864 stop:2253 length:390 start_codon:yes stop_codon:yes gene_type:complete
MNYQKIKIGSNKGFGIVFFVVFFLISIWPILNDDGIRIWSLIISLIFLILGIINSNLLTPLNLIWFRFGLSLGKIVSPIVMGLVYFFVVTPTGLIMRLFKKDLIMLKKNNKKTYWIEEKKPESKMKNQF